MSVLRRGQAMWRAVVGPGSAVAATASRLGWSWPRADTFIADAGRRLVMTDLSPKVVKREVVVAAVKRWHSARATKGAPGFRREAKTVDLAPLQKLLKRAEPGWSDTCRRALRSAISGGSVDPGAVVQRRPGGQSGVPLVRAGGRNGAAPGVGMPMHGLLPAECVERGAHQGRSELAGGVVVVDPCPARGRSCSGQPIP